MILINNSNGSTISITFPLTQCTIHEYKTGNNVSEFMHSNWITLSYYSSPNTRVWFLNIWYTSLTSVHSNLEHIGNTNRALVHSDLSYTTSLVEVQSRSDTISHAIPILSCALQLDPAGLIWFEPATANLNCGCKACQMPSGNFHYYLVTKLNADVTSGTQKLHCYWENQLKFPFLYSVLPKARSRLPMWKWRQLTWLQKGLNFVSDWHSNCGK